MSMLTRAYIRKLNSKTDNHFTVYIPWLAKVKDTEAEATVQATAIHIRGIKNNYKIGDAVYVDFVEGNIGEPVILGKLLTTNEDEEDLIEVDAKIIKAEEKAQLPNNTTIGKYKQNQINIQVNELVEDKKYIKGD